MFTEFTYSSCFTTKQLNSYFSNEEATEFNEWSSYIFAGQLDSTFLIKLINSWILELNFRGHFIKLP